MKWLLFILPQSALWMTLDNDKQCNTHNNISLDNYHLNDEACGLDFVFSISAEFCGGTQERLVGKGQADEPTLEILGEEIHHPFCPEFQSPTIKPTVSS